MTDAVPQEQQTHATNRSFLRSWPGYCAGIGLLFFLRGLVLIGFSPPFEGFDEPMHMAYLVHLSEVGTVPRMDRDVVPRSMYEDVVAYPHPRVSMPVVGRLGGYSYDRFYDAEPRVLSREPIPLYQAQHPPLYYQATQGIFARLRASHGLPAAAGILRVMNLAFAGVAMALFVLPLRRVLPSLPHARVAALAVGLFPMAVVYVARVGNDSLAMLFFAAAYLALSGVDGARGLRARALAAGLLIGVGSMTKLIAFLVLPAGAAYLCWLAILRRVPWRTVCGGLLLMLTGYGLVCGHHHLANLREYGTLFSEAGTVINQGAGDGGGSVLANIRLRHLWEFFLVHLVKSNLWISGWSYLPPPAVFEWLWVGLLSVCVTGAAPLARQVWRRERALSEPPLLVGVFCLLVVGAVFGGTYAHALNSISAWGGITTPQYYTVAGYPALLTGAFILLAAYRRRRLFVAVAGGMAGLFLVTETVCLVTRSLPHWAATTDIRLIFQRLGDLHGAFPSPAAGVAAAVGAGIVLGWLVAEMLRCRALRPRAQPGVD